MIAFAAIFVASTALVSCATADAPPQPAYGSAAAAKAAEPAAGPAVYSYNYAVADDYSGIYLSICLSI